MKIQTQFEDGKATLRLEGRLTFEQHREIKEAAYPIIEKDGIRVIQLDLSGVTYMDSSTLGMLLLLREKADARGQRVSLLHPSTSVMTILKVVQFDRLFDIQS
jgi:anti-anti-sigma factor